ncbi:MAG: hypothetical protein ABIY51_14225 [Ferruginibacter sp.]
MRKNVWKDYPGAKQNQKRQTGNENVKILFMPGYWFIVIEAIVEIRIINIKYKYGKQALFFDRKVCQMIDLLYSN